MDVHRRAALIVPLLLTACEPAQAILEVCDAMLRLCIRRLLLRDLLLVVEGNDLPVELAQLLVFLFQERPLERFEIGEEQAGKEFDEFVKLLIEEELVREG